MSVLWLISEAALAAEPSGFVPYETGLLDRGISLIGIFALVGLAWLISENRKKVAWRTVAWGVGLQLLFGLVILLPVVSGVFYGAVNGGVAKLLSFSDEGTKFVMEPLVPHAIFMKVDKPKSYVETGTDCDDADGSAHGSGFEVCDGADNDCDGKVDDGATHSTFSVWDSRASFQAWLDSEKKPDEQPRKNLLAGRPTPSYYEGILALESAQGV